MDATANAEKRSSKKTDEDLLTEAKDFFRRSEEYDSHNRQNWVDDMRFARLGEQWPDNVRRQRELDNRPCLTINRLPAFIREVTNDARQNKPAIKYHPVSDGADEATAEILNGLVKNIEYLSKADIAFDTALDHAVSAGQGYFRIVTDYASPTTFDQEILLERVQNPLSVYRDYTSTGADSADWKQAGIADFYTEDEFRKKWPKADPVNFPTAGAERDALWFRDSEIRVAEYWCVTEEPTDLLLLSNGEAMSREQYEAVQEILDVQGITIQKTRETFTRQVMQYILTGAEVLEKNKWPGQYIPIIPVYGEEVSLEGKTHYLSLIRFAKDPQQMFNYWRTASTELVALTPKAPYIGKVGSFNTDAEKWNTANVANHAYIEYDGADPPQRQAFDGPPAGALQEAMNASDDMKTVMGIFDASLGARSNETSGIAINERQKQGDVSTFHFIDNLSRAIQHAGRVIVDLIPHVYSTPRILRIIKDDGKSLHVAVNGATPQLPAQMQAQDAQDQQEQLEAVQRVYDLTTGKYDVTCEVGPSYATKREEASEQMMAFINAYPAAGQFIGDLIAKNQDWPGAEEIAERLKLMLPPQLQGQDPQVMALQQQLQQASQQSQAVVQHLEQQIQMLKEDKSIEQAKVQVDQFNAETKRMELQFKANPPLSPGEMDEMSEREKLNQRIAADLQMAQMREETARINGEVPIKVELLKQEGAASAKLIEAQVQLMTDFPDKIQGLLQDVSNLKTTVAKPKKRRLVYDDQGEPIGSEEYTDEGTAA